jgi:Flp pilus assembly protein TadG
LVILFLFALIVGSIGVSSYQEVAHLAREGARYASTHGGTYQREGIADKTGIPDVDSSSDLAKYLAGKAVFLDPSRLQVDVTWSAPNTVKPINLPIYVNSDPSLVPPGQEVIQNYVAVTVTYQWSPLVFPMDVVTLESTSEMPMSY